ncbi:MAG TPA: hypothetical protein DGK91_02600 [Clostridium sp.]|nr:hypothetical protein [Clostridia bacterium]HCW03511.1 hypothetical protein [Clostridium sp.]
MDTNRVKEAVLSFPEVKDVHKIRSRGTMGNLYIDLHVKIEANMNVEQSHKLIHRIEERIKEEFNDGAQLIVHIEPFYEY